MGKTLYHSELVRESPVTLLVKSEVKESKFQGKGCYVAVEYNGEDRQLQCEDGTEDALDGYRNKWVEITATGIAKDGGAEWLVEETDAPSHGRSRREEPRRDQRQERREPARRESAPRITEEDRIKELKAAWVHARKFGNLLVLCTEEARRVVCEVDARADEPIGFGPDEIGKLAVTIAIQIQHSCNINNLPLELPPLKSRKPEPHHVEEPVAEPDPERRPAQRKPAKPDPQEIEEDDIPF